MRSAGYGIAGCKGYRMWGAGCAECRLWYVHGVYVVRDIMCAGCGGAGCKLQGMRDVGYKECRMYGAEYEGCR